MMTVGRGRLLGSLAVLTMLAAIGATVRVRAAAADVAANGGAIGIDRATAGRRHLVARPRPDGGLRVEFGEMLVVDRIEVAASQAAFWGHGRTGRTLVAIPVPTGRNQDPLTVTTESAWLAIEPRGWIATAVDLVPIIAIAPASGTAADTVGNDAPRTSVTAGTQILVASFQVDPVGCVVVHPPSEPDETLPTAAADPSSEESTVDPMVGEPAALTGSEGAAGMRSSGREPAIGIRITAEPALHRELALAIAGSLRTARRQFERDRCLSCHLGVPLALTVWRAEGAGLRVPAIGMASLARGLAEGQQPDGGFHYRQQPRYPPLATTLASALVLAVGHRFDRGLLTPLASASRWLAERQQPDGSIAPDFQLDPLMAGRGFSTFVFALVANEAANGLRHHRGQPDRRLEDAVRAAQDWFANLGFVSIDKALFRLLAVPAGGDITPGEVMLAVDELRRELAILDLQRNPDRLALILAALEIHDRSGFQAAYDTVAPRVGELISQLKHLSEMPTQYRSLTWRIFAGIRRSATRDGGSP